MLTTTLWTKRNLHVCVEVCRHMMVAIDSYASIPILFTLFYLLYYALAFIVNVLLFSLRERLEKRDQLEKMGLRVLM